jgi:hypothetical protein
MIESLASSYTNMQQAQVQQAATTAVLKQGLDLAESRGAQIVQLLQSSTAQTPPEIDGVSMGKHLNILA